MFGIIEDLAGGIAVVVEDTVDIVVDGTLGLVEGITPSRATVDNALNTGMTLFEISDVTGVSIEVLLALLDD